MIQGFCDGIKGMIGSVGNAIKGVINSILGGIEGMANGVVNGVNFVIKALNKLKFSIPDWVPVLGGKTFGFSIGMIPQVSLPRLAKGNVAYSPLIALFGEYAGASNNPEITAPQNILRETFEDVWSSHESDRKNNSNGEIKQVIFQFGSYRVAMEMERLLKQAKRQNGTATVII